MMFFLLIGCSDMLPPQEGKMVFCPPANIDNAGENGDVRLSVRGVLQEVRSSDGECDVEIVVENEGETYVFGYSILDPDDVSQTQVPTWETGGSIEIEYREKMVFGTTQSIIASDDAGVLMALEEGYWGGSIEASELPFSVGWSELIVAESVSDCMVREGYQILVNDESFTPFFADDFNLDGTQWEFYAVAAVQVKDGASCSVSDKSDHFSWAAIRQ